MRVPLSWIRDFVPVEGSAAELAESLNNLGLVVEGIDEPGREVQGVVVAKVLAVSDHPDADKLTLVDVDAGDGEVRVVCGARNLTPGDVIPYAPPGAMLPGGMKLERRKIRGVASEGMLCSASELGLGDDGSGGAAGILHLAPDVKLGEDVRSVLGLDDVIFDLEITPNRPDAMSVVGVARDLAAALGLPFHLPTPKVEASGGRVEELASVVVEAPERCPRYVARVATVQVGPSPQWMARRLMLAGMRPISNVVDVTNYVLLERGQPLHAFDLALLNGRGVLVRLAVDGERIVTLDGVERHLAANDLLICDAQGSPQAIAGVMGGGGSEVSATTVEILLESAYFTPQGILVTSKHLGLRTESSARFERGVDPNGVAHAADRACELLAEVAHGTTAGGVIDAYPTPIVSRRINVRVDRVNRVLGTKLHADDVRGYLQPLGMEVAAAPATGATGASGATKEGDLEVTVPTFRPDIEREIDCIEEVARHHGYNNIERTMPRSGGPAGGLTPEQRERRLVRDALVGAGCLEAFTFSLVAPSDLGKAGLPPEGIDLENPLRAEESLLRPALLPGLFTAAAFNAAHGNPDVALFEVGHVFGIPIEGQTLPNEREHLAVVLTGTVTRTPHEPDRPADVHDAMAIWEVLTDLLNLGDVRVSQSPRPGFHPARSAALCLGSQEIGSIGAVAYEVIEAFSLPTATVALEVDLDAMLAAKRRASTYLPPSRYPASTIDLAFVVEERVPAGDVRATIVDAAGELAEQIRLFDEFRGPAIGDGRKSLAFALRFRSPDRTLTDEEVATLRSTCIDAVLACHNATLRG